MAVPDLVALFDLVTRCAPQITVKEATQRAAKNSLVLISLISFKKFLRLAASKSDYGCLCALKNLTISTGAQGGYT